MAHDTSTVADLREDVDSGTARHCPTVVLVGLESSGKTTLFRSVSSDATGAEANFRGSTVVCRRAPIPWLNCELVDTPGIRVRDDSMTTQLAIRQLQDADCLVLVVRGTHANAELDSLIEELAPHLAARRVAVAITFGDKAHPDVTRIVDHCRNVLGVPAALLNARERADVGSRIPELVATAAPMRPSRTQPAPDVPVIQPAQLRFERASWGTAAALLAIALMFGAPVWTAYVLADRVQRLAHDLVVSPFRTWLQHSAAGAPLMVDVLVGDFGIFTLGWYSFVWAFPVVVLIGASVAIAEETGLKDRVTAVLDPWLRAIGLNGRDLIPVLTGFGCNVVAVVQSRSCSACSRRSCVSMVAFGSACSYQIGASLSVFNAYGKPWWFAPYVAALFIVGAIHTRVWIGRLSGQRTLTVLSERAFLQRPSALAIWWRVRASARQFVCQAMPIFLAICVMGAVLAHVGVTAWLSAMMTPALTAIGLPAWVAPAVVFSIIRKDGLLVVNQGDGTLIRSLTDGQLFLLVFLTSTLTTCMVTAWTIRQELGMSEAVKMAGRQAVTAVLATLLLGILCE